ncbi:hypothetical protein amrb99_68160 [Actinomadura sp. RB99]|uniref:hypothetical protein n=1 Tax=Actinomadura sp. RB99 TaxID=2691577 RepID=UPI0019C2453A|nr:hypothetical protein [Actinomadura sp. RB99]MBD2897849.1 hypothetical protein [Actinomadura sp. RB99]
MAVGAGYSGTFTYTDTTTSHHEPQLTVTITPRVPDADTTQPGHGVLQIRVRCDDEFEGLLAGCVNPAYIPTMTQLPDIATNIRGIQARGGYGVPGKPAFALHREADPAEQRENREEACNIRVTGPARQAGPATNTPSAPPRKAATPCPPSRACPVDLGVLLRAIWWVWVDGVSWCDGMS